MQCSTLFYPRVPLVPLSMLYGTIGRVLHPGNYLGTVAVLTHQGMSCSNPTTRPNGYSKEAEGAAGSDDVGNDGEGGNCEKRRSGATRP